MSNKKKDVDESSKTDSKTQKNNKDGEDDRIWPQRNDPQSRLPRVVIKWLIRCQKERVKRTKRTHNRQAGVKINRFY